MKHFLFLAAVSALSLTSCFTSFFDLGEEKVEKPETSPQTFVEFINSGDTPVSVYSASDRLISSKIIDLNPNSSQKKDFFPSIEDYSFYLKYYLPINGVRISYIPQKGQGDVIIRAIPRDKTTAISIPALAKIVSQYEILVNDAYYLAVKNSNEFSSSCKLLLGTSLIMPESLIDGSGNTIAVVNGAIAVGETALYKITQADLSQYAITVTSNYALSTAVASPEKGHLYSLNFNGTSVALTSDTPITLANVNGNF